MRGEAGGVGRAYGEATAIAFLARVLWAGRGG